MQSLLCLLFSILGAYVPFTERGQVDFDVVLDGLKSNGAWVKNAEGYGFVPKASEGDASWTPFRDGKWIYTDRGWMFEAYNFESWITNHYGYWKRENNKWIWIPQGYWQSATVAWITTGDYIGWYPIQMGPLGELVGEINVEKLPIEGWSFIPIAQFGTKMSAKNFASPELVKELLKKAVPSYHKIKVWREVEYPGPSPAEVQKSSGSTFKTRALKTLPAEKADHPPELPDEYYLYRPKFFQDNDGIQKRIEVFLKNQSGAPVAAPKVRAAMGIEEMENSSKATASSPTPQSTNQATNAPAHETEGEKTTEESQAKLKPKSKNSKN